ncbi:hypothetical protein LSTR_LSTR006806 [Laodelphax striatellus]|uniref:RRM domain-containing protein n=1 Tax=Laodelphax striatellus TaxID=195883 RepID=A0A482WT08_LAOST|nr:hypothetical protein LSTR_LSTR006806 [Laodelphax striatellus]
MANNEAKPKNKNENAVEANGGHTPDQKPQMFSGRGGRGGRGGMNHGRRFPPGQKDDRNMRGGQDGDHKDNKMEDGGNHGNQGRMGGGGGGGGRGGGRGGFRGGQGGGGRGGQGQDDRAARGQDDRVKEKLSQLRGPTSDLPPQDNKEKKFTGRCRLYIGNLNNDITEEELNALFTPYGETFETFINKEKNFGFVRLDYRANAEKARRDLDGSLRKGRPLRVRFAPLGAALKVKNLTPYVTNELLELSFSVFGEVERAVVITDERGNSTREGVVEFSRKPSAMLALRKCAEGCFFMDSSLKPVIVEPFETIDDTDGYSEKSLTKKTPDYYKAREIGPRFAAINGFEFEYGTRWKQLHELYKQKEEALNREMKMEEEKLEAQMEYARYEHETEVLREQLRLREMDRERQKREWEMKERQAEDQRRVDEEMMRRQQEEMQLRMHHQEDELRRRQQENSIFMQVRQVMMASQQEQALRQAQGGGGGGGYNQQAEGGNVAALREYEALAAAGGLSERELLHLARSGGDKRRAFEEIAAAGNLPLDPKAYMEAYERGARFEEGRPIEEVVRGGGGGGRQGGGMEMGGGGGGNQRGRWGPANDRRQNVPDDFPAKRRRF